MFNQTMNEFQMKWHNNTTLYLSVYIEALQRNGCSYSCRLMQTHGLLLNVKNIEDMKPRTTQLHWSHFQTNQAS
jgi:hypothetical protein